MPTKPPRPPRRARRGTGDSRVRGALAGGLLVALACVAFFPAFGAGFVWDDDAHITRNLTLRSLGGLARMWFDVHALPQYYPLVHTTFWVEYHLWGLHPLGYHVTNVALHGACAVLVWRLLSRLEVPGAWLGAAIFAVHPVYVESVVWVTERKNVLSLALALGSMLCYLRFERPEGAGGGEPREALPDVSRWGYYWLSLALFTAALFSKTVVTTLPAVLLVVYWWKRGRIVARDVARLAPFFLLSAAFGLLTAWVEKAYVKASGSEWDFGLVERVLIAGRAVWFYAAKLVWPHPLVFTYPRWEIDRHDWRLYAFPAAALALVVGLWLTRKRLGRGPLAAVLIFGGVLVPALGFFDVYYFRYSFVADHFQYHASIALAALGAAGAAMAAARLPRAWRGAERVAAAALLLILMLLSILRSTVYHDLETLCRDIIAQNPNGWAGYSILSGHLDSVGREEEAFEAAHAALRHKPDEPLSHSNLAALMQRRGHRSGYRPGQLDAVIAEFQTSLHLGRDNVQDRDGLGFAYIEAKRPAEAQEHFEAALRLNPLDPYAAYGMGVIAGTAGNSARAFGYFQQALKIKPDYLDCLHGQGIVFEREGRLDEAAQSFAAAVRVDPKSVDAHDALAGVLIKQGKLAQAVPHYGEVLRQRPEHTVALGNLGYALMNLGHPDQAIPYFQQVLRIDPDNDGAKANLAQAHELLRKRRRDAPAQAPR